MKLSKINMGLLAALEGQGSASKGMWGHKSYVMRFSWLTLFLIPLKIRSEGRSASKGKGVRGHKSNVRRSLADFVLHTLANIGLLAVRRSIERGCGDTSPMS